MDSPYDLIIGLEVHVQLLTASKLFCACGTRFGAPPNTQTCPVCTGMPGALPVLNRKAVELAVRAALALDCRVASYTKWDRKQYYYPDLPKGYQISQYDLPIGAEGHLAIQDPKDRFEPKRVGIQRVHLEEDAGKSMHDEAAGKADSRIDLNRAGTPLLEIVSRPDLRSPEEAKGYLTELKLLLEYLGVSDCNMQEGSLRVDANVNLHVPTPHGTAATPIVEVKNMNSFRAVERAMAHEAQRQYAEFRETGRKLGDPGVTKVTRGWDDAAQLTRPQRSKEESSDYRYFPDPDLVPVQFSDGWLDALRASMPEMPDARAQRYQTTWGLSPADARLLVEDRSTSDFFEACVGLGAPAQGVANWMNGELLRLLNADQVALADTRLTPQALADVIGLVSAGTITGASAKQVFEQTLRTGETPAEVVKVRGLAAIQDASVVESLVDQALADNPDAVQKVQSGKLQAIKFLVGQVMKLARGRASASEVEQMIRQRLGVSE